jgi:hypothetical protein
MTLTRPTLPRLLFALVVLAAVYLHYRLLCDEPGPRLTCKEAWLMAMNADRVDWIPTRQDWTP